MREPPADKGSSIAGRSGFVLPMVVMVLVLLAAMGITLVAIGQEEGMSARAMRESALAFYAAEAGVNQVRATLPDSVLRGLEPGDSVDLGGATLPGGSSYHAKVMRFDNDGGGQAIYALIVDGRGPGPQGGQRTVSVMITSSPGSRYRLGLCCDAALTIRGEVSLTGGATVDGTNEVPDGWSDACPDSGENVPGIIMADTTAITISGATVTGDPPLVENADLADSSFDQFGDLSYDSIRTMADHILVGEPSQLRLDGTEDPRIQPSQVFDPNLGKWVCDTSDPYNWGSNDPLHPCFDYFPIILIRGEVEVHEGYGQAVVIIDWDDRKPPGEKGGEFELETDFVFNGLILGKGCVEIQKGADFHGAVFVDANYRNADLCGGDSDYDMNDDQPVIQWSQCAVNRSIEATGLYEYAETDGEPAAPLGSRAFLDLIH